METAKVTTPSPWLARLGVAALILALIKLGLFGVLGVRRNPNGFADTIYFHAAGRALLAGQDPYDPATLRVHADGGRLNDRVARWYYPPQSAPLFMLLGLFSYPVAKIVLLALNLAAAVGLCFLALRALRRPSPIPWLLVAIILGDPWFVDALWYGNVVAIIALFLMGGWMLVERGRPWLGGVLLGLATFKPQFALLPLIWMLFERQWKVLAAAGGTALACMTVPLTQIGPVTVFGGWLSAIRVHHLEFCNALGFPHLMGVPNLLFAFGLTLPHLEVLGILATFGLWTARSRLRREDILGLLTGLSVTLIPAHDYDIAALVPLLVAFWRHLAGRPREAAVALALALILVIPSQLLSWGAPWVYHRTTVTVLILTAWLIRLSTRPAEEEAQAGDYEVVPTG